MEIDNCDEVRRQLSIAEGYCPRNGARDERIMRYAQSPLVGVGFIQALTELTERQALQYGIRIILDIPEKPELSDDITLALFRVVQESVANSARHGRAKIVRISLRSVENGWWLEITDDGAGFDVPASLIELRAHGHRGLANMHERMALVGGHVEILSQKGRGNHYALLVSVGDMRGLPS
jgi:Signal transduction histidine kinase